MKEEVTASSFDNSKCPQYKGHVYDNSKIKKNQYNF